MTHPINQWLTQADDPKPSIRAVQTTRFLSPNQAFCVHPEHHHKIGLEQLTEKFQLPHHVKLLRQVHGNQIIEYQEMPQTHFQHQADACFTRKPGIVCAIMTADCLPVLMTDKQTSFVAAVHCGWRSLIAGILDLTVKKINSSHEVYAWFGPCIQAAQYEVDAAFVENYLNQHPDAASAFSPISQGKSHADLYQLASLQLQACGVKQIQQSNECTYLSGNYYSWRENQNPHRMATMIWIEPPHQ
ncbi:peptidoglycan editing factor PgeF [Marinicella sp. S1101]|uniref:peptidoglycan editing factor PgeF n=1 Tax=Marinicella marina TaxID=2996016 RepID=UPI002260A6CC|nr:peptidoglycan editing factor PgeF [Marinicella marina]MCX7552683.1 peptidoglycan editing factor PgeF [Marinicella marina]MDJ1139559.1 peptidoglycan editing factor PgeF [Marinicella marina]